MYNRGRRRGWATRSCQGLGDGNGNGDVEGQRTAPEKISKHCTRGREAKLLILSARVRASVLARFPDPQHDERPHGGLFSTHSSDGETGFKSGLIPESCEGLTMTSCLSNFFGWLKLLVMNGLEFSASTSCTV
jgi:hypothetical protein